MTVSTTLRFGLTQWSAGTDPYRRTYIHDSLGNLETKGFGHIQGTVLPSVGSELAGYFFFHTVDERMYYCDGSNPWWIIIGAEGPFGDPVTLGFADTVGGDGVSDDASRATHVHAMPGFSTPVGVGVSAGAGTGEPLARSDHAHNLNAGSVDVSTVFQAGAVTGSKIVDLAVTSAKLASNSVDGTTLGGSAVTSDKILNNSISNVKLGTAAVTGAAVGTIDASKVTTSAFAAARIPNLNANKITSGTIDPARLPNSFEAQPGVITMHPSNTTPISNEWLPCDGQQITDVSHPALHAVLAAASYPFGGTGASANVPDLRDVFPLGVAVTGTGSTLGVGGGALAHTHSGPSHLHAANPGSTGTNAAGSHSHDIPNTGSAGGHSHSLSNGVGNASPGGLVGSAGEAGLVSGNDVAHAHTFSDTASSAGSHSHSGSSSAGSHGSHVVSGTSSTKTSANAIQHNHTLGNTGSQSNHTHSITTSGSNGSHGHSLNFASTNSSSAGTGNTGTQNPPYVVVAFWIKT